MAGARGPAGLARTARRLAPVAMELYRRWQQLTPEEKERYRARARGYTERARVAAQRAQERRRRPPGGGPPGPAR